MALIFCECKLPIMTELSRAGIPFCANCGRYRSDERERELAGQFRSSKNKTIRNANGPLTK